MKVQETETESQDNSLITKPNHPCRKRPHGTCNLHVRAKKTQWPGHWDGGSSAEMWTQAFWIQFLHFLKCFASHLWLAHEFQLCVEGLTKGSSMPQSPPITSGPNPKKTQQVSAAGWGCPAQLWIWQPAQEPAGNLLAIPNKIVQHKINFIAFSCPWKHLKLTKLSDSLYRRDAQSKGGDKGRGGNRDDSGQKVYRRKT